MTNGAVVVAGTEVPAGYRADVHCTISESYTGDRTNIPMAVINGAEPGPRAFVTAGVHGDELNGIAVCRELLAVIDPSELRGVLVVVPIVNVLGAQIHSRYLPDRRDLNRSFPGTATGSLASRMARMLIDEVVHGSDVGVDLHTAANRRTNIPQLRIDTADPAVLELALAFGAPYVLDATVRSGSLREAATAEGVALLTFEGGEAMRFEEEAIRVATTGVLRILRHLGIRDAGPPPPDHEPLVMHESKWMRAQRGGIVDLHVSPGDAVTQGQALWTTSSPLGAERSTVDSPFDAVVIGGTTVPLVSPGDAVLHLGLPGERPPAEDDPTEEEDLADDEEVPWS